MAYCTNTDVKTYANITGSTDDTLLTSLVARAQATIDSYCRRTFEASTNTSRTFDAVADVEGLTLHLDEDLCAINSITNGDAVVVTSGQYVTEPRNDTPYYAIRLTASDGIAWTYTDDPENAITISGKWAYSTSAPADIVHACVRLATYYYRQRDNSTVDADRAVYSSSGAVMMPPALPSDVIAVLKPYRKVIK